MDYSRWTAVVSDSMTEFLHRVLAYLPNILSALLLLLLGWLLARLFRGLSSRIVVALLNRFSRNAAIQRSLDRTGLRSTIPRVVSSIVYWFIILFFAAAAIEKLEMTVVTTLLADFAAYLPKVLLGIMVFFVGLVAGNLLHHTVSTGASSAGITYSDVLGRLVQVTVILVAVVIAADQIGIQSTFLMVTIAIIVGTTLGGAALAFGLGSGPVVGNIISSYYLQKTYRVGQQVRIGGVEGRIDEMTPTSVFLATGDGRVSIPAKKFNEEASTLLT